MLSSKAILRFRVSVLKMADKDLKVLKLEETNYVIWKWQFKNVLDAKGLGLALTDEATELVSKQALALLGSTLSEDNMLKIISCTSFGDAWRTLEQCFETKTAYEAQSLFRRLFSMKFASAAHISAGISEVKGIVARLTNLDEKVSDNILIGAMLEMLPSSFDFFQVVWRNDTEQTVNAFVK